MTMPDDRLARQLEDVTFPDGAPHEDCVAAVAAVRAYIHDHDGATKAEIVDALEPLDNYPIGLNGVLASLRGFGAGFDDWWWEVVVRPGLRELPDVEPQNDAETAWAPSEGDES